MLVILRKVSLFFLVIVILGCSSNRQYYTHPAIDLAIENIWKRDTCESDVKSTFIDTLLDNPIIGLDTVTFKKWFGNPVHRRYFKDDHFVYVYFYAGHPRNKNCSYSDLFCVEFNRQGKLINNFIYFILEDEQATAFWHSQELPEISEERENNNDFLKYFYR